jgi:hypothetical protein
MRLVARNEENAVEIITCFFGRNRKARFIDNLDQRTCRDLKRCWQVTFSNRWEIFAGQGRERETRAASVDGHPTIGCMQLHLRTIWQFARNFEQGMR